MAKNTTKRIYRGFSTIKVSMIIIIEQYWPMKCYST